MHNTNIISFANIVHSRYQGFRVRFSFIANCGRNHEATAEQVWAGDHYFTEVRDICCNDVETDMAGNACPDSETVTQVELVHPDRKPTDHRQGKRQRFIGIPDFGERLGL